MSNAEVLLLAAEAAERGWIPDGAADLYEQGIAASLEEFEFPARLYYPPQEALYDPDNIDLGGEPLTVPMWWMGG